MKKKYIEEAKPYWENGQALKAGQIIYEHIKIKHRPLWAAEVLEICRKHIPFIPEVEAVYEIATNPERWSESRLAFSSLRQVRLRVGKDFFGDELYQKILSIAEKVAKVTYNASGGPAPFDQTSGASLVVSLRSIVDVIGDPTFSETAWHVVACEKYCR